MQNQTLNKFNQFSKTLEINKKGALIVGTNKDDENKERQFFKELRKNSFLGKINTITSASGSGECLGVQKPNPSRTNTEKFAREPQTGFINPRLTFKCTQINFDTCVSHAKLDALADYLDVDFTDALTSEQQKQILHGLLMVGFNGESQADTSDSVANPMTQDVTKGWIKRIKENAPQNAINAPTVGKTHGVYKDLNALIKKALQTIDAPLNHSGELVAICGREIIPDFEKNSVVSNDTLRIYDKQIGGVDVVSAPYFPDDCILITELSNLSLYVQKGTLRTAIERKPRLDSVEFYNSLSLDFIVENPKGAVVIEKVEFVD